MPDYWKKSVRYAAKSDTGLRRSNNQDSFLVRIATAPRQWLDRGHLFIVADGMGAHVAGEVASRLATETIAKSYLNRLHEPPDQAIVQAVYDAHNAIRNKSKEEAYREMGTTCDAFALTPQGLLIAHVGDSRVYRLRGSVLDQMTFDHSLVWEVCAATNSPFDQPPNYIPKNQITRSLGPTERLVVDLEGPLPIEVGDTFLACSDGLSGQVEDREIGLMLSLFPPDVAAETLVNLANLRGGPDNITMVIAQASESTEESQAVDEEMTVLGWHWGMLAGAIVTGTAAAACLVLGQAQFGILLAIGAVVAGISFSILTQKTLFSGSPFVRTSLPSGKAPYRSWNCLPTAEYTSSLAKILRELLQAAKGHRFSIQTQEAQRLEGEAMNEAKRGKFSTAIKCYAMAINCLMRELKKLNTRHE